MKKILPHISIVLSFMTLTLFVIDRFNEYMAFMTSEISKWLFAALAVSAIITSILLIRENFREEDRIATMIARRKKREERKKELED